MKKNNCFNLYNFIYESIENNEYWGKIFNKFMKWVLDEINIVLEEFKKKINNKESEMLKKLFFKFYISFLKVIHKQIKESSYWIKKMLQYINKNTKTNNIWANFDNKTFYSTIFFEFSVWKSFWNGKEYNPEFNFLYKDLNYLNKNYNIKEIKINWEKKIKLYKNTYDEEKIKIISDKYKEAIKNNYFIFTNNENNF